MNEYTGPQAFSALHARGRAVRRPRQQLAVVSHIIPTHAQTPRVIRDAASLLQAQNLAHNCERAGIRLFAARAFVAVCDAGSFFPGRRVSSGVHSRRSVTRSPRSKVSSM